LEQNPASLDVLLKDSDDNLAYHGQFSLLADPDPKYDELYRWYASPDISIAEAAVYNLTLTDLSFDKTPQVLVDKVLVVWGAPAPIFYATQSDDADSDDDGIQDGVESFAADFWIEAEHYPSDEKYVVADLADPGDDSGLNASGSQAVRDDLPEPDPNGGRIVEIPGRPLCPEGAYQVFIRARADLKAGKGAPLHVEIEGRGSSISEDLDLTDRYEWTPVQSQLTLDAPGTIQITLFGYQDAPGSLYVDKILLTRLDGHSGSILKGNLPRDFADPLDPDSDGDGLRPADGALEGSMGYLTDGWERHIHTNSFSIDTDQDAQDLTPGDPDPMFLDDADLNPLTGDTDEDGINDGYEILSGCMDPNDDDTDEDGIIDGNEDANTNGEVDAGETDPCDADSDGDALPDDQEVTAGTNPWNTDSDGDGVLDGAEIAWNIDSDGDGWINATIPIRIMMA